MGKELVLAGAGHAHLAVLARLDEIVARGHRVTVVSEAPCHYYSGMGPGLLAGRYGAPEVRFQVGRMTEERGGRFLADEVVSIDAPRRLLRLASGDTLGYDVASFNVGSSVPREGIESTGPGIFPVKPIEGLLEARRGVLAALERGPARLLVVGGGPAGLEVAGALACLVGGSRGRAAITLAAGESLLPKFPEKVRRLARESLVGRGLEIVEGARVTSLRDGMGSFEDGRESPFDVALVAVGVRPPSLFRDSGLPTGPGGGLLVDGCLRSPEHPELFGGGDCIHFAPRPLDKVGVYAVRQGPLLFKNLLAALEGREPSPFLPQSHYLLIFNLGDGRGIFHRRGWVWDGRGALWLKERIDRGFMRRFQLSGEGA